MNGHKWIMALVAFALMGSTAGLLARVKANHRLGEPGVKTRPLPGGHNLQVVLPERALDYTSEWVEEDQVVTNSLPKDTSYGQRLYTAPDGFWMRVNVVLMGSDRTSIHKPQFCLRGQGWDIDARQSSEATVRMERPQAYALPVMKLIATKQAVIDGRPVTARGLYVYWFVADGRLTARHGQRMWWSFVDLARTGVLERWAYVACFSHCEPGQEEATFERMKQLIAATVPEFQLIPKAKEIAAVARQ